LNVMFSFDTSKALFWGVHAEIPNTQSNTTTTQTRIAGPGRQ